LTDLSLNSWLGEARSRTPQVPILYLPYFPDGFEETYFDVEVKALELFHRLKIRVSESMRGTRDGDWLISQDRNSAIRDKGFQAFLNAPHQLGKVLGELGYMRS
jgi:hypothetical protein